MSIILYILLLATLIATMVTILATVNNVLALANLVISAFTDEVITYELIDATSYCKMVEITGVCWIMLYIVSLFI